MVKNIIVAIDENKESLFKNIVDSLDNKKCMIKIGSVAFNSIGHELIADILSLNQLI